MTVVFGFVANLAVAWVASLGSDARPKAELKFLVYPLPASKSTKAQGKQPEVLAVFVMLITLVLALLFALGRPLT